MIPPKHSWWINKYILLGLIIFLVCAVYYIFFISPSPAGSCKQLRAKGISAVTKDSRYYNAALDNDHDGIACE